MKYFTGGFILVLGLGLLLSACGDLTVSPTPATVVSPTRAAATTSAAQTTSTTPVAAAVSGKKTGPAALYPNPALTPGDVFPNATAREVCVSGYTKTVRDVSEEEKKAVFQRYNVTYEPGKYEVDHFISLELGGSNDVKNLWPEPYEPKPGAREKDQVEDALHREVCAGRMTLEQAQETIRQDWYAYYLKTKSNG